MKTDGETVNSDQTLKPSRPKSRQISSRYLSPKSTLSIETGFPYPNHTTSPLCEKPRTSTDTRNHRSHEDGGVLRRFLPASSTSTKSSNKKLDTLADHLGNEIFKDLTDRKTNEKSDHSMVFSRQRSCTELINRFENKKGSPKENHRPIFGGSMRYTGKSQTKSSSKKSSANLSDDIVPGRFSVDENALRRLDSLLDTQGSESYMASGIEVSSKSRRRWTSDSNNIPKPVPSDNSRKKFTINNVMKRANSLTKHGSATSKSALSPGRPGSPPKSVENKGKPVNVSSSRPPTSPSKGKSVGNLLSMGLGLFKKASSSSSSPLGPGRAETVYQLWLLHSGLMQLRYANARADAVNRNLTNQAQKNLLFAWDSLTKLRYAVQQKKIQLEKEKLEMKLNFIIHSQIKALEGWGDVEKQHLSALSITKDCLHSAVCKVPLIGGAKVETQAASIALRHASDLTASIKSMLSTFSPMAQKTVSILSELAEVVVQEKALLEECLERISINSTLEVQERSLRCNIIQLKLRQQQQQQEIPS